MSHTYNLVDMQDWMRLIRLERRVTGYPSPRVVWSCTRGLLRDNGGHGQRAAAIPAGA